MAWNDTARVVDLSHWNPEDDGRTNHRLMDYGVAKGAGLAGMIAKYSQGAGGVDPAAYLHAYNAYAAGIPLLGGYHFGDGSDPEGQAEHFRDCVKGDYGSDLTGILLMLDAERNKPQMTVPMAEAFVSALFRMVGRWPWYYGGKDGPDGTGRGLPSPILSNCALLVAAYGDHAGNLAAILPKGWRLPNDAADRGKPGMGVVRGWQFTDGQTNGGPFPGLGRVDQSRLIGVASLAEAQAVWAA